MKKQVRIFLPEEKSKELDSVMGVVKEQVKKYRIAKKQSMLRKATAADSGSLFNV